MDKWTAVRIKVEVRNRLKVLAAQKGMTISDLVLELVTLGEQNEK